MPIFLNYHNFMHEKDNYRRIKTAVNALSLCIVTLFLLSGCNKEENGAQTTCHCDVNLLWSVSNKLAKVEYNPNLQKWYLARPEIQQDEYYHEYYPQNLDKVFQKEGLEVRFSGDVYYMGIDDNAVVADKEGGEKERCCIDLLSISETTSLEPLEGEWRLVGWQHEGKWWQVDPYIVGPDKFCLHVFPNEEYMVAASLDHNSTTFINTTIIDNRILFDTCYIDNANSIIEDAQFFNQHIGQIRSYIRSGSELRLYYSDSDYFLYTNDFDDNKPFTDKRWFDGPNYPYMGKITKTDKGNGIVTMQILDVLSYPITGSVGSVYLHHPGAQSICHFYFSGWTDKTIAVDDKILCYITRFQQTDNNEPNRTYNCEVKPYEERELVVRKSGVICYDNQRGWYIKDEWGKTNFYPMRTMADKYLLEGCQVFFSGYYYTAPENKDYYYIELTQLASKKEMFTIVDFQNWIVGRWKFIKQENTLDNEKMQPHTVEFKEGGEAVYTYEDDVRNNIYCFLDNEYYQTDLPVVCISGSHDIPYVCHINGNRLSFECRDFIAPGREKPLYIYERIE